jgi:tetratricopeptide (TPR) repeat protein
MMTDNPALNLYKSHRFREAIAAYRQQLRDGGPYGEWVNLGGLAAALMAAGEYAEAIPHFEKMDEHASNSHPGALGYQVDLSICRWMIGERAQASDIIKGLVVAVRKRKVYYTDFSGGVPYGLILCYMAATLRVAADVDLALKYLKWLTTRRYIKNWPGPAGRFLLGQMSFQDALVDGLGVSDVPQAKAIALQDVMKRRHLTNLLFAAAVERRLAGDEPGCRACMADCASLKNTLCEDVWYLARAEIGSLA